MRCHGGAIRRAGLAGTLPGWEVTECRDTKKKTQSCTRYSPLAMSTRPLSWSVRSAKTTEQASPHPMSGLAVTARLVVLTQMLDRLRTAVVLLDEGERIVYCNQAAGALIGRVPRTLAGVRFMSAYRLRARRTQPALPDEFSTDHSAPNEVRFELADAEGWKPVRVTRHSFREGMDVVELHDASAEATHEARIRRNATRAARAAAEGPS